MLALAEPDFVDGDDVGMLQRGRGDRLGAEPLHRFRRRVRPEQQQLEGDDPIEALLAGLVDHAHAAVPDLLQQLVVAEIARLASPVTAAGRTDVQPPAGPGEATPRLRQSPDR